MNSMANVEKIDFISLWHQPAKGRRSLWILKLIPWRIPVFEKKLWKPIYNKSNILLERSEINTKNKKNDFRIYFTLKISEIIKIDTGWFKKMDISSLMIAVFDLDLWNRPKELESEVKNYNFWTWLFILRKLKISNQ